MEAVFFQFLARELAEVLPGSRVEKVFLPAPNVITLALYIPHSREVPGCDGKKTLYLHARYGTGSYFLFLSAQKTAQPDRAPSAAMRLRKYLRGRRVARVVADWPGRRLTLVMAGEGPSLVLDPRGFPALTDRPTQPLEEDIPAVAWPPLEAVRDDPDIWQTHPQLSPGLRRRLAALPPETAKALYARLTEGAADGFYVESKQGEPDAVWPLAWPASPGKTTTLRQYPTAIEAATAFGAPLAFGEVSGREAAPESAAKTAGKRRLVRALARLAADEARMREYIARRSEADALAASLHTLDKQAKITRLSLPVADGDALELRLDPSLTVVQNMQKLYHLATKGERGLTAIAKRRGDLQDQKKYLQGRERSANTDSPVRTTPSAIKGVAANVYRTSDGFLALRGKNAKANDQLLRLASPFDLWFHAANGPGAHVILRRDHPGREVPRQSIEEAAGLAALASFASGAGTADVIVAKVGDVRRIKGAPVGQVSVGSILETVRARVDPALEILREPV
jgi:hypothetical protein